MGLCVRTGGEPETKATWFRRSAALRADCGLDRTPWLTTDAVMDGFMDDSVAEARKSGGRLLLLAVDESLRDEPLRDEDGREPAGALFIMVGGGSGSDSGVNAAAASFIRCERPDLEIIVNRWKDKMELVMMDRVDRQGNSNSPTADSS